MIDKKTVERMISMYERKVDLAGSTTDSSSDYAYALHSIYDELITELCIKSNLLSFEKFLQDRLNYDNIKVLKLSEKLFEVIVNYGDLIDESKTMTYTIDELTFIVKTAISSQITAIERSLIDAVKTYNTIKEQ